METLKNISLGIFHGLWDSIKGMTLVLYIDAEIHKQNEEKLAERQRRSMAARRSPSPTPSSASTMGEPPVTMTAEKENPDERSLASLRKKSENAAQKSPRGELKIAKQVFKCCILNGGFTWLSIILFEQLLLPTLKFVLTLCYGEHSEDLHFVWGWLQSILSIIFGMMWVLPIFLLSKIVSSLWFADIANAAYRVRKGRPHMIPSISKLVADFLFSLLVQALFLVQSMLVNLVPIPWVGSSLCFLHLCLLYSLYSFEYKWFNMGWELHRRLSYIECNWPYFLGFGIPLTVLTNSSSSIIVSSCIFSIFFPLFILSGNEAKPLVGTTGTPMHLFSPVIFVANLFFHRPQRSQRTSTAASSARNISPHQQQQIILQQQKLLRQQQQQLREQQELRQQRLNLYNQYMQQQPLQSRSTQSSSGGGSSSSARNTPDRNMTPSYERERFSRRTSTGGSSGHSGGMRPLIPTPAPGTPKITTTGVPDASHR